MIRTNNEPQQGSKPRRAWLGHFIGHSGVANSANLPRPRLKVSFGRHLGACVLERASVPPDRPRPCDMSLLRPGAYGHEGDSGTSAK